MNINVERWFSLIDKKITEEDFMIQSKSDYNEYIKCDEIANHIYGIRQRRFYITWKYLKCLRGLEYSINCRHRRFKKISVAFKKFRLYKLSVKSGISIPPNVFGKGLFLPHHGLIVVNSDAKFGDNCVVQCGVNISDGVRAGNHIYIGAGAKIIRRVNIADDVIIGANAVVTKDITEANIAIAGIPAKKISENGFANRTNI